MSVFDYPFPNTSEPTASNTRRLARPFRRAGTAAPPPSSSTTFATTAITHNVQQVDDPPRRPSFGVIEPARKSSLAGLPLRLMRSRTKPTVEDTSTNSSSSAAASAPKTLGAIFFSLPNEIQAQILSHLDAPSLLAARLTSHSLTAILHSHATSISRAVLARSVRGPDTSLYLATLYPLPRRADSTAASSLSSSPLAPLLQILRRQALVEKTLAAVVDFVEHKIYQVKTATRRAQFAPVRRRMRARLTTAAWIVCHFLETLRASVLSSSEPSSSSATSEKKEWARPDKADGVCWNCAHVQCGIINASYPTRHLLPALQFFRILLSALRAKLTPPSYAGSIERRLRGWDRDRASEGDMVVVLLLGGLGETVRVMGGEGGFVGRVRIMRAFVERMTMVDTVGDGGDWQRDLTKSLDAPDGAARFLGSTTTTTGLPGPAALFQLGARSRVVTAAVAAGTVESNWAIPDAFTFIQDVIAGRETGLGESEEFDPNVDFEQSVLELDREEGGGEERVDT